MVKAVLFDLYETLITQTHIQPTRASTLAATLGLERDAYRREWKSRRPRVVTGELSFANALSEISQALAGRADADTVQRICEQRLRENTAAHAHIDDAVATAVAALAKAGVRLGVISNGFEEDVTPWAGCSLAPAFRCTVFSCRERVAKPNPDVYLRALQRLGVDAENAVYIGDGGDDELAGAEQAGLRAFRASWFVRNPQCVDTWPELARPHDVLPIVWSG